MIVVLYWANSLFGRVYAGQLHVSTMSSGKICLIRNTKVPPFSSKITPLPKEALIRENLELATTHAVGDPHMN
jgi:hypothetical protein